MGLIGKMGRLDWKMGGVGRFTVLWNRDMCWISAMRVGNGFCRVGMEGLSDGMLIGWVRNRVFNDASMRISRGDGFVGSFALIPNLCKAI